MSNKRYGKVVGVGNILIKDGEVLLVLRSNTGKNDNLYGLIGGGVEPKESVKEGAIREIEEEIGVAVKPEDLELVHCISSMEKDIEVVSFYFLVKKWEGEPFNKETHKHAYIKWFYLNALPENMITLNKQALEMMQKKIPYSEYGYKYDAKNNLF